VIVNQQAQQQREDERGSSSVVTTAGSFTSASTSVGKRSEDDREGKLRLIKAVNGY
jgi:hypothetical protein